MQRLEFSGAVRPLYGSLGVKGLNTPMDTVVFDYIQLPSTTHTTGMTRFLGQNVRVQTLRWAGVFSSPHIHHVP